MAILDFIALRSTTLQILSPESYDEHTHHFHIRV